MKVWLYIIISAIFQTFWGITLKILDMEKISFFFFQRPFDLWPFLISLIPLICYFAIGLTTAIFLSKAYKLLPMSMVYAYWMGLTLIFQAGIDLMYFQERFRWEQYIFLSFILIGIIGMKISASSMNEVDNIVDKIQEPIEDNTY